MQSKNLDSALVIPVYNESKRWKEEYWNEILSLPFTYFIFVNDGSTDDSLHLMNSLRSDKIVVLNLLINSGKAEALRAGFKEVISYSDNSVLVAFMDSDGAFNPEEVGKLLGIMKTSNEKSETKSIWGSRVGLLGYKIERKMIRHYIGRIITTYLSAGRTSFPYDSQCGLKYYVLEPEDKEAFSKEFETRWFYDLEIWMRLDSLYKLRGAEFLVEEVPLRFWRDVENSRITNIEKVRILFEIYRIRRIIHT
jgi:dolichyl-phosphate beta-glucosyltransferase